MISLRCIFISPHHTMYCNTKPVERCQCCQQRVALSYTHSSADFLGNYYPSEVVNSSHNSGCFHIYILLKLQIVLLLSVFCGDLYCNNLLFELVMIEKIKSDIFMKAKALLSAITEFFFGLDYIFLAAIFTSSRRCVFTSAA